MINEELLISQIKNSKDSAYCMTLLLQYRNEYHKIGYVSGWDSHSSMIKKSKIKIKNTIIKEKDRLLDNLHEEIAQKKLNGEDNIQDRVRPIEE
jgi:hypothetical protein